MIALAADYIPLAQAHLCADCDSVTNSHTACTRCGSKALLPLAPILNRRTQLESR